MPDASAPPTRRLPTVTAPQASLADASRAAGAPPGALHSALTAEGQIRTGGIESRTVTTVSAVLVIPCESVTRRVIAWEPSGRLTLRISPDPSELCAGWPRFSNQSY